MVVSCGIVVDVAASNAPESMKLFVELNWGVNGNIGTKTQKEGVSFCKLPQIEKWLKIPPDWVLGIVRNSETEIMQEFECRLCSGTTSLISLFSGKNKRNRDIIRKLASETVNIQFEEGDLHTCICYSCVVQIYNTYIFQVRAKENEERLQNTLHRSKKVYKGKQIITPLKEISLPRLDFLKQTFAPWLQEKLAIISEEIRENEESSPKKQAHSLQESSCQVGPITETTFTQTLKTEHANAESQTSCEETDVSEMPVKRTVRTQTKLKMTDELFQSYLVNNNSVVQIKTENKYVQCYFSDQATNTESSEVNCEMQHLLNYLVKSLPSEYVKNMPYDINKFDSVYHGLEEEIKKVLCGTKSKFLAGIGLISADDIQERAADDKCGGKVRKIGLRNQSVTCDTKRDHNANRAAGFSPRKSKAGKSGVDTRVSFSDVQVQTGPSNAGIDIERKNVTAREEMEIKSSLKVSSSVPETSTPNLLGVSRSVSFSRTCKKCGVTMTSRLKFRAHKKSHKNISPEHIKENGLSTCERKISKPSLTISIMKLEDFPTKKQRKRNVPINEKTPEPSPKKRKSVNQNYKL